MKIKFFLCLSICTVSVSCAQVNFTQEERGSASEVVNVAGPAPVAPPAPPPVVPPPAPPVSFPAFVVPAFSVGAGSDYILDGSKLSPSPDGIVSFENNFGPGVMPNDKPGTDTLHGAIDEAGNPFGTPGVVGFHYQPDPGFVGTDIIKYKVTLPSGQVFHYEAKVEVVNYAGNRAPVVDAVVTIMVSQSVFVAGGGVSLLPKFAIKDIVSAVDPDGDAMDLIMLNQFGKASTQEFSYDIDGASTSEIDVHQSGKGMNAFGFSSFTLGDHFYDFAVIDYKGGKTVFKLNLKVY